MFDGISPPVDSKWWLTSFNFGGADPKLVRSRLWLALRLKTFNNGIIFTRWVETIPNTINKTITRPPRIPVFIKNDLEESSLLIYKGWMGRIPKEEIIYTIKLWYSLVD